MLANKISGTDSNSSFEEVSNWHRGLTTAKQSHVIVSTGLNPDDDGILINKSNLKNYTRDTRKYCKTAKRCN